jgi:nucleotidyltransferase substrate binding protein (TIGR01987 family)
MPRRFSSAAAALRDSPASSSSANRSALQHLLDDLGRALDRLGEALAVPEDAPLAVDGSIQRFEFTFDLFWKALRRRLAGEGITANSPKAVLQQVYRLGWLDDEARWLKLLQDRNLSSQTYRQPLALEIYRRIPRPLPRPARGLWPFGCGELMRRCIACAAPAA